MNYWYVKYMFDYGGYIMDGLYFYCDPYGYLYSKLFSKETLKQACIVSYPYTKDMLLAKLAREVPVKEELELDDFEHVRATNSKQ